MEQHLRLAALLAVLAVLAGAATAAAAPAVPPPAELLAGGMHLTLQDDRLPVAPDDEIAARLDRIAAAGVTLTRVDVLWNDVAPTRPADGTDPDDPAYRWSRLDRIVDGLAERRVAVLADVYRSPAWANGGRGPAWAPGLASYTAFMRALARRYDGRTPDAAGVVHARIGLFEPWNEPNIPLFLMPQWQRTGTGTYRAVSPRTYARMLTAAYGAVKDAQPDAWVVGVTGAPSGSSSAPNGAVGIVPFIRALAPSHPPMDAYSQHVYPALGPTQSVAMPSFRRIPDLLHELDAVRPGLPLLITEMGYTTARTPYRSVAFSEDQQASWLPDMVALLAAEPRVRLGVWFNAQDNPDWPGGLLRQDGTAKPSWDVFVATPKLVPAPMYGVGVAVESSGRGLR